MSNDEDQTDLGRYFADNFNTFLGAQHESEFQSWATQESLRKGRDVLRDTMDYDLRGYWLSGEYKNQDARGHGADKYKKPNHPTFSDASIYNGAESPWGEPFVGGKWAEDGSSFTPSDMMLRRTHKPGRLKSYMERVEPDVKLDLSDYRAKRDSNLIPAGIPAAYFDDRYSFSSIVNTADEISMSQMTYDALTKNNWVASLMVDARGRRGAFDPEFSGIDAMPERHAGYEMQYAEARNAEEAHWIGFQIDEELAREDRRNSGASNWFLDLVAASATPDMLIPLHLVGKGARLGDSVARGAVKGGASVGSLVAAQEFVLQQSQATRTAEESTLSVSGAVLLGGVFGASMSGFAHTLNGVYGRSVGQVAEHAEKFMNSTDEQMTPRAGGDSVGAARAEGVVERPDAVAITNRAFGGVLKAVEPMDPVARGLTNSIPEVNDATRRLAETALYTNDNVAGEASRIPVQRLVETVAQGAHRVGAEMKLAYGDYLLGRRAHFGETTARIIGSVVSGGRTLRGKAAWDEFKELIGHALANNDDIATVRTDLEPELVEAVNRMARSYRKNVYDPILEDAIKAGVLESIPDVKGGVTYLNRVYNKEKLADPHYARQFEDVVVNGLRREQETARQRHAAYIGQEREATVSRIRGQRAQARVVEQTVERETASRLTEQAKQSIDKALEELGPDLTVPEPTPAQVREQAMRSARRKYLTTLRDQLEKTIADDLGDWDNVVKGTPDDVVEDLAGKVEDAADEAAKTHKVYSGPLHDTVDDITNEFINQIRHDEELSNVVERIQKELLPTTTEEGAAMAVDSANAQAIASALDEAAVAAHAEYQRAFEKIMNDIQARAEDADKMASEAHRRLMREATIKARKEARKAARKATEAMRKELKDALGKFAEREKLASRDEFDLQLGDNEHYDIAATLIDNIIGMPNGRLPYFAMETAPRVGRASANRFPRAASAKGRKLTFLTDKELEPFLVRDISKLSLIYARSMATEIGMRLHFPDDVELTKFQERVSATARDDAAAIMSKATQDAANMDRAAAEKVLDKAKAQAEKVTKEAREGIEDVLALRDVIRGTFDKRDPLSWTKRGSDLLLKHNFVTKLGYMTLAAIPDIAAPTLHYGLGRAFKDLYIPMIADNAKFKSLSKELANEFLTAIDVITNSRMNSISGIADDFTGRTLAERGLNAASDAFGMATLMSPWNAVMKTMYGAITVQNLVRLMRKDAAGTLTQLEEAWLRANYISTRDSAVILDQLAKRGNVEGQYVVPDIRNWEYSVNGVHDAAFKFRAAVSREVEKGIITPGLERPLSSMPGGSMGALGQHIFQFKSFAFAANHRLLLAGLQRNEASFYSGVALASVLGMISFSLRTILTGKDLPDDWRIYLAEGIDRSGATGIFGDINNIISKLTNGSIGLRRLLGVKTVSSKYQALNSVGSLLGPTFGTIADLKGLAGNTVEVLTTGNAQFTQSDVHTLRKQIWGNQIFWFNGIADRVEQATVDTLGIPKQRYSGE